MDEQPFLRLIKACFALIVLAKGGEKLSPARRYMLERAVQAAIGQGAAPAPAYSMHIDWSEEDDAYVVSVPDLPGCMTHGATYEEAARNGEEAIASWVGAARDAGDVLPTPTADRTYVGAPGVAHGVS